MFNDFDYRHGKYVMKPDINNLSTFQQLINLCGDGWVIDVTGSNRQLFDGGIITLKKGYRVERYPYLELLLYKMPQIIFSNNKMFMKSWQRSQLYYHDPFKELVRVTNNYHVKFKHNKNFKL